MDLSDLQQQLNAAHEAFNNAQTDVKRLTTESMTAMKAWVEAQTVAEKAYGVLAKKQTDHARALMALHAAKLTIISIYEQVQIEMVRKSAQA